MEDTKSFAPAYQPSSGTAAGGLAASVTVAATTAAVASAIIGGQMPQIQIANQTASWAYVNFGQLGAVVAATVAASYPVGPGAVVVVSVSAEVNAASVILAAGATSGSVTFTRGNGI